jgi:hypothetical protein
MDVLREATPEKLLKTYAALTHRIQSTPDFEVEVDYREQRDLVQAEIIRRINKEK